MFAPNSCILDSCPRIWSSLNKKIEHQSQYFWIETSFIEVYHKKHLPSKPRNWVIRKKSIFCTSLHLATIYYQIFRMLLGQYSNLKWNISHFSMHLPSNLSSAYEKYFQPTLWMIRILNWIACKSIQTHRSDQWIAKCLCLLRMSTNKNILAAHEKIKSKAKRK